MGGVALGGTAIWYAVQCLSVLRRESAMRFKNEERDAVVSGSEKGLGNDEAVWKERARELEAENTRLQALVCYLVHANEELRSKYDNKGGERLVD